MPYLMIRTNQTLDAQARGDLLAKTSRTVAEALGKPERYVMVSLEAGTPMCFAGSDAPLAYLELKSIGLPADGTARLSQILCELMEGELGISADRVYIEFADAQRHLWGWNGGTF